MTALKRTEQLKPTYVEETPAIDLNEAVAPVTGAPSEIGAANARAASQAGARVVLADG